MSELKVSTAVNGFVVYEMADYQSIIGKMWAFESPSALGDFMETWARGQESKDKQVDNEIPEA